MRIKRRHTREDADLDVTSFMNLMIILVPVLLISMVLARTTVLDLKLPGLADTQSAADEEPLQQLELVIRENYFAINYPAGMRLKQVDKTSTGEHDYKTLSLVLQEVKRALEEKNIDKKEIIILSEKNTDYQTLVTVMDTARSFKAVVAASVVDAELFPEISLGDAPTENQQMSGIKSAQGVQP